MPDIDDIHLTREEIRLDECRRGAANWRRWGPYLSDRQWGTVREDYSESGSAWTYFSHDQARSRAYRWGEDGLGGICDRYQLLCFALALWNGRDPILKERLFGLTGDGDNRGNHGEDVKELYYYLDSTPTHSYMKLLYKYPQAAYPYSSLVSENGGRGRDVPEYELLDTGVFEGDRYFDIFIEYAKISPEDIAIRITAHNRGPEAATLHLLPTLWFRNTWAWGRESPPRPSLSAPQAPEGVFVIEAEHQDIGTRRLLCGGAPNLLFTENETNAAKLFPGGENRTPFVKDGIHEHVVHGRAETVNPARTGTKASAWYRVEIPPGGNVTLRLRLTDLPPSADMLGDSFDAIFTRRAAEADDFYAKRAGRCSSPEALSVQRQAFAGLLMSKQLYYYNVAAWQEGDPPTFAPPGRIGVRNKDWRHIHNADVISMPDKWEYPWYAAWDLAFHCIPLAVIDPDFAKAQLVLLLRERYIHPNGQIPAYEWNFSDVNPPVFAWAAFRVYKIERRVRGRADRAFLKRIFHKLLVNFTWWVNQKDREGDNVFEGGFLGLDNVGLFDRSKMAPGGGHLEQSDGTSWMGMYCLNMLAIALELSLEDPAYDDIATKFLEHFVQIAHAMDDRGIQGFSLWDEQDGFYYDVLHLPNGQYQNLRVRSMVGITPLFAVETLEPEVVERLPVFKGRLLYFLERHPELRDHIVETKCSERGVRRLLALVSPARLPQVLRYVLSEAEFLSPYGVRSLSKFHAEHPVTLDLGGTEHHVAYEPAESRTGMFGGNSNWRGPVWFPVNFLLIESLQKFHHYLGDDTRVEHPTGSGEQLTLWDVAADLSRRLTRLFLPRNDKNGRPFQGDDAKTRQDPHFRDYILFYEYFHGDTGMGLGASHQTGWTALVAKLIEQSGI